MHPRKDVSHGLSPLRMREAVFVAHRRTAQGPATDLLQLPA